MCAHLANGKTDGSSTTREQQRVKNPFYVLSNGRATRSLRSTIFSSVAKSPTGIALDLSNESDRLARLAEVLCVSSTRCFSSANRSCELTRLLASLETARSLPRLRSKPETAQTNTRTMHHRNTHVQHTRVLRKTLCVRGIGFAFVLERDCVLESLLSVSLWPTAVRWLLIDKLTLLGILPSTKPFLLRRPFRVAVANKSILLR